MTSRAYERTNEQRTEAALYGLGYAVTVTGFRYYILVKIFQANVYRINRNEYERVTFDYTKEGLQIRFGGPESFHPYTIATL